MMLLGSGGVGRVSQARSWQLVMAIRYNFIWFILCFQFELIAGIYNLDVI